MAVASRASLQVLWKAARRLQLIPDCKPRDHVPILCSFPVAFGKATSKDEDNSRWDYEKLASCTQKGLGRAEFLMELQTAFKDNKEKLNQVSHRYAEKHWATDEHWEEWMATLSTVAKNTSLQT